jgi:hypothetical protein
MAKRILTPLSAALAVLTLAACGSTVSTSGFKGEQHRVAQAIANLQSDATGGEQKKICANDVAGAVVKRLGGTKGCEKAFKDQLAEVDNLDVTVESVQITSAGSTATASVKSTYGGKHRTGTVNLVKESGEWKLSSVQ